MKRYLITLMLLICVLHNALDAICIASSPGRRVWKIAADNVDATNTIESKNLYS